MWFSQDIITGVDRVARIHYVDKATCRLWNERRSPDELRLLTGWCWTAKSGRSYRQGFKTKSVCYRDAYYALVQQVEAPPLARPKLRVVASRKAA